MRIPARARASAVACLAVATLLASTGVASADSGAGVSVSTSVSVGGSAGSTSATGSVDADAPDLGDAATTAALSAPGPDGAAAPAGSLSLIVKSTSAAVAAAAVIAVGGTVTGQVPSVNGVTAYATSDAAQALSAVATVVVITGDAAQSLTAADGAAATGTDATVTPATAAHQIGADAAYAAGLTGAGIDVAVLDTGVAPVPGLVGSGKLLLGPDLSTDSQSPLAGLDGFGHGTAMASIIGSGRLADGYQGIAPGVRLLPVKVGAADGSVDVSQVIAGIDWVVAHAHDAGVNVRVLNISFGSETLQPAAVDPLVYAAENAWRHGIVVVTSIGNDGRADNHISSPALDNSVLSVGAADTTTGNAAQTSVAPFSSLGNSTRHADLLAPGVHMLGLRDPGSTLDLAFPAGRRGTAYFRGSGTSHAAAVVSGAVALLLQQRPSLTPDQVKALLVGTADPIATAQPRVQGAGLIDLGRALAAKTPVTVSSAATALATGTGTLELARAGVHLAHNGVQLVGESTVLGAAWDPVAWAAADAAGTAWQGTSWLGTPWPGATPGWQGTTWQGTTWQGTTWQGTTWQGTTWQGTTWQGTTWQGTTWQGTTWQGTTWQGQSWQGTTWQGSEWAGATWTLPKLTGP